MDGGMDGWMDGGMDGSVWRKGTRYNATQSRRGMGGSRSPPLILLYRAKRDGPPAESLKRAPSVTSKA